MFRSIRGTLNRVRERLFGITARHGDGFAMEVEAEASTAVVAGHAETGRNALARLRTDHLLGRGLEVATLHQRTHAGADRGEDVGVIFDSREGARADGRQNAHGAVGGLGRDIDDVACAGAVDEFRGVLLDVVDLAVLRGVGVLLRFERLSSRVVVVLYVVSPEVCSVCLPEGTSPVTRTGPEPASLPSARKESTSGLAFWIVMVTCESVCLTL